MTILIGILSLGFLIFFHELGHLLVAKACKIKVNSFSVGFGPVLLHKTIKGIDYRLSAIPLGGYCGMKGEEDFTKALDQKQDYIQGEPDSFYGCNPWKRILVLLGGPLANLLFGIVALTLVNFIGFTAYKYSNYITVPHQDSTEQILPSVRYGLVTGDRILEVNGIETQDFESIAAQIRTLPDQDINLKIERDSSILDIQAHTESREDTGTQIGYFGISANEKDPIKFVLREKNLLKCLSVGGILGSFNMLKDTMKGLIQSIKAKTLLKDLSGPGSITHLVGSYTKQGFTEDFRTGFSTLLELMAFISITLFITNLLPIPKLDGGMTLISLWEAFTRKKSIML